MQLLPARPHLRSLQRVVPAAAPDEAQAVDGAGELVERVRELQRAEAEFARTAAQTSGQTLGGRFRPSGEIDDGKSLEGKA